MPQAFLTAKDQLIWTQRIQKEESKKTPVDPNSFSIRSAISHMDVAKRFKPGHIDHGHAPPNDGFHPDSAPAAELKKRLEHAAAPLRDKVMFPETAYQDHGWYQKDPAHGPERQGRSSIAGALPRAGFGWNLKPCDVELPEERTQGVVKDPYKNQGKPVERPPFAFVSPAALKKVREQRAASGNTLVRGNAHCGADRRADGLGTLQPGSSPLGTAGRSASMPALGRGSAPSTSGSEPEDKSTAKSFEKAMERHRIFMNRNPKYSWYVPTSNSDVSLFVDNYTKSFGMPFYGKQSQKGVLPKK